MPNLRDADRLEGELAERWGVSEDGLVHSFTLRPGAVFASGKPVTAADAAFSLQRAIRLNKSPAFILGQFGFTPDNVEEKITASGENTLLLRTTERQAPSFVLACLTANVASIVERDVVLSHAVGGDLGNAWLRQNSAGSGPWVLRSWRANESVVLDRNLRHHGAGSITRVVTRHVADSTTQLLLLQQGDADIARNLGSDQLRALPANLVPRPLRHVAAAGRGRRHAPGRIRLQPGRSRRPNRLRHGVESGMRSLLALLLASPPTTIIAADVTTIARPAMAINVVPLTVRTPRAGFNRMVVRLTVCDPGTDHCATIDDIMVDTGSTGLRIEASAIPSTLNLPSRSSPTTLSRDPPGAPN